MAFKEKGHSLRKAQARKIVLDPDHKMNEPITTGIDETTAKSFIYNHYLAGETSFYTEKTADILGHKLVEWAISQPGTTKLMRFFWPLGMDTNAVLGMAEKFPNFGKHVAMAREIIGGNLWEGALRSDSGMREGAALRYLGIYDKEYKAETERLAKLKDNEKHIESTRPINVIMVDSKSEEEREKDGIIRQSGEDKGNL